MRAIFPVTEVGANSRGLPRKKGADLRWGGRREVSNSRLAAVRGFQEDRHLSGWRGGCCGCTQVLRCGPKP